jgi:acyl-CoA synthetase (AMP-forming)/AMP-acid ligase II
MRVFDILKTGVRFFQNNRAVVNKERAISYRNLYLSSLKVADYLQRVDIEPGSRVALLYGNSIEYVILFFAIFKAGHIAVPLDTSLRPEETAFIISDCGAQVLLFHSKYRRHLDRIIMDSPTLKHIISDKPVNLDREDIRTKTLPEILDGIIDDKALESYPLAKPEKKFDLHDIYRLASDSPRELAAIFYTSGSTGTAKGVMLSHRNLVSNTVATIDYLKLRNDDSVIVILPFYYIYGNSLLLTHMMVGGTLVIDNRFLYPEVILDTMEREKVTGFSGVPSNFIILLNNSTMPKRKLEHLRYFTQAGGAMAPELIKRLMNSFPQKEIYIMYGQTEAAPRVSYCPPEKLKEKIGSIGIPLTGVQMKVVDESGRDLPVGKSGELITTGDNVMLGYWNQPGETAEVLKDGWLYTGDLAKTDESGYFFITGRKKEIIKTGGNRVSAKEIEECILENDKVLEAAVFGIEDDLLGEAVKAVVVLKKGQSVNQKDIQAHCKSRLAEYKVPKYVEFRDLLPKYQSGKVNKLVLRN